MSSPKQITKLVIVGFLVVFGLFFFSEMLVGVDQNDIMVIQSLGGRLEWFTNGGYHCQCFGKVTKYHKRDQVLFMPTADNKDAQPITVRFNDGGHADLFGSISWNMPLDVEHLNLIQQKYGSQDAVDQQLVKTVVVKSAYMTGPLMSSAESYAERRNDLIQLIEDQTSNGVLQTQTIEVEQPDPITGEKRLVAIVKPRLNEKGLPLRQEESPLATFGIKTYNLSLSNVKYDEKVEAQIQQQQQSKMQVQTSIANAKMAEQAAITAAKNGEAEAAKAKWAQEVIKAQAVTEAQQKLAVAELDTKAAAQYKQAQILKGEGEGAYKRAVMQANGALEQKLDAWVKVNEKYAEAIANYQGNLTPSVVFAGSGAGNSQHNSVSDLVDLMKAKTAKEIGLDFAVASGGKGK